MAHLKTLLYQSLTHSSLLSKAQLNEEDPPPTKITSS